MNKQIIHDALVLTAFTLVIGVILGAVYGITKTPIDKANEQTKKEAYQAVFADASGFNQQEYDADAADKMVADAGYDDTIDDVEQAVDKDGNALGYVIENGSEHDAQQIAKEDMNGGPTLGEYVRELTQRLHKNGKHRSAEIYMCTLRSFMRFRKEKDLLISQLDSLIMEDYESYLRKNGLTLNTISFYMKRLRAIYNKALEQYGLKDRKPFAHSFTKNTPTAKRALTAENIHQIVAATTITEEEALARDLFLFSFYTRGMSFVDIAFLEKGSLKDGQLIYKRKKTGKELRVAWRPCMQEIADRHPSLDGKHLLGIVNQNVVTDVRKQYHYRQCRVNKALQKFTRRIGIPMKVTMYCARHSWATIAKEKNIPISVISDSMGHNSEKITRIYLKSINDDVIDRYNDMLIEAISI